MLGRIKRMRRGEVRARGRRPRVEPLERRDLLAAYRVTTAADSGAGSLREAITLANADNTVGADSISFLIDSGTQTIALQSPLPTITRTVAIDATTQPPAAGQSAAAPRIILDGSNAGAGANGLTFSGPGGNAVRGLAIVNFDDATNGGGRGILAADAGSNNFTGNYLGMDPDGTTIKANVVGIELRSPNNVVGTPRTTGGPAFSNLISGNTSDGVLISSAAATRNQVVGNQIGTNALGTLAAGNLHGVTIASASGNLVGGTGDGTGNLISGNVGPDNLSGIGVYVTGTASGNFVQGNLIGTDISGTSALSNVYGVFLGTVGGSGLSGPAVAATTVGGVDAGGNLISGNGVGIYGSATGSLIAGNLIGTDATGDAGIGNGSGIFLAATNTQIGGTTPAARNVIASSGSFGGGGFGIQLSGDSNTVSGNYIGTNAAGTAPLPNVVGIALQTSNTTIGGVAAGAGNLIAGNSGDGITLNSSVSNRIYGNTIGTTAGDDLGNGGDGINIILVTPDGQPSDVPIALNDVIGDPAAAGNTIAGNSRAGVAVTNASGIIYSGLSIRGNDIRDNGLLGISLGSNASIATPGTLTLTSVASTATGGTITGVLGGTPGVTYLVDLYANAVADLTGYGEGQTYLGTAAVVIGPGGLATFSFAAAGPLGASPIITATSTLPTAAVAGVTPAGTTSEFSAAFPNTLAAADLAIAQTVSAPTTAIGGIITFTATITNNGPATARGVVYTDAFGTGLSNVTPDSTAGTPTVTGANIVTVPIGDLAPGASVTITVSANGSANGNFTNTAGVLGTTPDSNYDNNLATQTYTIGTPVRPSADLAIAVSPSTASPVAGSPLTYTIIVTNNGPTAATGVVVTDFLPAGASLVGVSTSQGTANSSLVGNLLTSTLGDLAVGATATVSIVITPSAAGSISNTANVSGGQPDPVPGNNSVTSTATVGGAPAGSTSLTLTQSTNPGTGAPGQIQLFVLTVRNTGTAAATGVVLVDALPAGATYVYAGATTGAATTFTNNVVTSNLGTIAPGASATVILVVVPNGTTSSLSNFAGVIASGDSGAAPAFSTAALSVPGATVVGPSVTSVVGSRSNAQLVVNFSEPITRASATNKANYRLYALGLSPRALTANDRPIAITSIFFNPATNSVALTPSRSINSTQYYALVVVGNTARGITDTSGRKLVGVTGGTAGTNYSTTFFAGTLPQG